MMKVYFWSYDIFEQYINCDDDRDLWYVRGFAYLQKLIALFLV